MNILDIPDPPEIPKDIWPEIWKAQKELHEKYKAIEEKNRLGWGLPLDSFDIDDRSWQYYIKDMMWRVTEELQEAKEAAENSPHMFEELIDALHFLVELNIIVGLDPHNPYDRNLDYSYDDDPVYHLGIAANCLKNKPWKNDFKETDEGKFLGHILDANTALLTVLNYYGMDDEDIYILYFKKNQVNQFRIRSNY